MGSVQRTAFQCTYFLHVCNKILRNPLPRRYCHSARITEQGTLKYFFRFCEISNERRKKNNSFSNKSFHHFHLYDRLIHQIKARWVVLKVNVTTRKLLPSSEYTITKKNRAVL